MSARLKHVAEYAALRVVGGCVNVLPYRAALGVGWVLALAGFHIVRFRRREAERRIREVFGDRYSARETRRIAWISFRNLLFSAIEILRSPRMTLKEFDAISDFREAFDVVARQQAAGRGAILAFPHMGSWELPGRALLLRGMPVFSVAGRQKNPLFDRYLNATREKMGVPIVMRGSSALKAIVTRLKGGGFLALLPDVRMPAAGVRVRFLGQEANVGAGMALFARHAGVPIYPAIMRRIGWARHEGRLYPPIESDPALDKKADVQRLTQEVMDLVAAAIQSEPEQWFWYNKRWIFDPVEPENPPDGLDGGGALRQT